MLLRSTQQALWHVAFCSSLMSHSWSHTPDCKVSNEVLQRQRLGVVQHESLALLKELLFALDLALYVGTPADKRAADRLQRRSTPFSFLLQTADLE